MNKTTDSRAGAARIARMLVNLGDQAEALLAMACDLENLGGGHQEAVEDGAREIADHLRAAITRIQAARDASATLLVVLPR